MSRNVLNCLKFNIYTTHLQFTIYTPPSVSRLHIPLYTIPSERKKRNTPPPLLWLWVLLFWLFGVCSADVLAVFSCLRFCFGCWCAVLARFWAVLGVFWCLVGKLSTRCPFVRSACVFRLCVVWRKICNKKTGFNCCPFSFYLLFFAIPVIK